MSPAESIDEIGPGELRRTLDRFAGALEKLDQKLDKLTDSFVPREVFNLKIRELDERLTDLGKEHFDLETQVRTQATALGPDFKSEDYVKKATVWQIVGAILLFATVVIALVALFV